MLKLAYNLSMQRKIRILDNLIRWIQEPLISFKHHKTQKYKQSKFSKLRRLKNERYPGISIILTSYNGKMVIDRSGKHVTIRR